MKNRNRHRNWYRVLRRLAGPAVKAFMRFSCEVVENVGGPAIILANHTTNLDPALVALSFPEHMYFVASEHIFRAGLVSRVMNAVFAPIPRVKGTRDARTVREILGALREGVNVGLFAEGSRTFNGAPCEILPSTGKLVQAARATLVTYRIEGGFFTSPRWGKGRRKGRMKGYVVGVYPPEVLRAMTVDALNSLIARDLHEDAYTRQAQEQIEYHSRRRAQYLEISLYMCPKCKQIGTMHSEKNRFFCDCGFSVSYTPLCYFEGEDVPFATITQWDAFQAGELKAAMARGGEAPLFIDKAQSLFEVDPCVKSTLLAQGEVYAYKDRFCCGAYTFFYEQISDMAIVGRMTLIFSTKDGVHYEIKSSVPRSATKYMELYTIATRGE